MSTQKSQQSSKATAHQDGSLLEQAVAATRNTDRSRAEMLIQTLAKEAMAGTVTWNKNLTATINEAIKKIDENISKQLTKVLHAPELQKLEGSWRGMHYLIANSSLSDVLKVRLLNVSKEELSKDFSRVLEPTQSVLFDKVYEDEYGTPGE